MNKCKNLLPALITGLFFSYSCAYNVRLVETPAFVCDSTIKYTYADVESIFINNGCKGCHTPGNPTSAVFQDKASVTSFITAKKTRFLDAINHRGPILMPKGRAKLPQDQINKLEAWICQGMK
jgi:hypothetical protein